MKNKFVKYLLIGVGSLLSLAIISSAFNNEPEPSNIDSSVKVNDNQKVENEVKICNGVSITKDCVVDGIQYSLYIYHPEVIEEYHFETTTTYTKEIVSYCTLCNDNTYSPSCATGSGACSHHKGVKEWNAPVYKNVAHESKEKIIDIPAAEAWYEKVVEEN